MAPPGPTRLPGSSPSAAKRRWETTGPAFWLMPIWSSDSTSNPARSAAVASTWLTVTMPVPPMPARKTLRVPFGVSMAASGMRGGVGALRRLGFSGDVSTVTKDGQSPSRHE